MRQSECFRVKDPYNSSA